MFRWGIKILVILEGRGAGLHWETMNDRSTPKDPVTMNVIFGMFIVDMIIYGLITWYVDGVKPGQYGVAKKWYFPVQVK